MGEFKSGLMSTKKILPVRYSVKEGESGRFLTCVEAPNIDIHIERGFSVSSSAARKYPENTIFLDGAAQGQPFIDVSRKVYNLDHHEGCVRAFTLATCEQAMVLILKGLDLRVGDWRVYGNEPDLDTIVAIWIILNHMRLTSEDDEIRHKIAPLVRLQGLIDSHGLELRDLSGFSHQRQRATLRQIEELRSTELELKKDGLWQTVDFLEYTGTILRFIDDMVYSSRHFDDLRAIEELARVPIASERIAVMCASDEGIYEVEAQLRKIHGDRLGMIILQKDANTYTVRQTDPFLPMSLDAFYERLNTCDPRVRKNFKWGGSSDIGGSPRGVGTGLTQSQIAGICRWVFQPANQAVRMRTLWSCAAWTFLALVLANLPSVILGWGGGYENWFLHAPAAHWEAAVILAAMGGVYYSLVSRKASIGVIAWKIRGLGWLAYMPFCCLAFFLACGSVSEGLNHSWIGMMPIAVAAALGSEVFFRGAVYGALVQFFPVMRPGGKWFLSVPLVVSSALSGWAIVTLYRPSVWLVSSLDFFVGYGLWVVSAVCMVGMLGIVRERWRSLTPTILLQSMAVIVVLSVPALT